MRCTTLMYLKGYLDYKMKAIILAAGEGSRLRPLTDEKPKCLVEISGKPALQWQLETFNDLGISDISIVTGYKNSAFETYSLKKYYNASFADTNMIYSLFTAQQEFNDDLIISYGDIIFNKKVLSGLLDSEGDIVIASDREWRSYWESRYDNPLVDAETFVDDGKGNVISLGKKAASYEQIMGQYIGLIKCTLKGIRILSEVYQNCLNDHASSQNAWNSGRPLAKAYMTDMLNFIASEGLLKYSEIRRGWFEIDNFRDLKVAEETINKGNGCF